MRLWREARREDFAAGVVLLAGDAGGCPTVPPDGAALAPCLGALHRIAAERAGLVASHAGGTTVREA